MKPHRVDHHGVHGSFRDCHRSACGTRMTHVEKNSVSVSIDVPNLVDAIRFYTSAFGFTESSAPLPGVAVLRAGNTNVCLLENRPAPEARLTRKRPATTSATGRPCISTFMPTTRTQ